MIKWKNALEENDPIGNVKKEKCEQHNSKELGYIEWHCWASEKAEKGHKQKRCPECGYWFFKCEF